MALCGLDLVVLDKPVEMLHLKVVHALLSVFCDFWCLLFLILLETTFVSCSMSPSDMLIPQTLVVPVS